MVKKLKSSIYFAYKKLRFEKIKEPKNDNYFNGLKEKFKSTNAEKVLKDLIYKRRYLYYIPEQLIKIEGEILSVYD